jgi:hypothetical protein
MEDRPVTIHTDNRPRLLICYDELAAHDGDAASDFEYLTLDQFMENRFVKYKGSWYDVNDTEGPAFGWDSHISETFFSGVLFRWPHDAQENDFNYIIVGRYYV